MSVLTGIRRARVLAVALVGALTLSVVAVPAQGTTAAPSPSAAPTTTASAESPVTAGVTVLSTTTAPAATVAAPTVKAPWVVVKGNSATITITGKPGATARVQFLDGATWKNSSVTVKLSSAGTGKATWKPAATRTYRVDAGGAQSSKFTIKVISRTLSAKAPSSVVGTTPVTATATTVLKAGTVVTLQYKSGTTWKTLKTTATVSKGVAKLTWTPSATRTYRLISGKTVSNSFTVTVVAPTVKVSAPASIVTGGSAKATVTTNLPDGTKVTLQTKSGTTYTATSTTATTAQSKATLSWKPTKNGTYRVMVGKVASADFAVKVLPAVSSITAVAPTAVAAGMPATVVGTISPAGACTSLGLQYQSGTSWVTDAAKGAVVDGNARITWTPSATRTYRLTCGGANSATFAVTRTTGVPASFTFRGSGWGHGVGMSQYGANAMSQAGKSAADILTYYYTGTKVETLPADRNIRVQVFGSGSDSTTAARLVVRSPGDDSIADGQWRLRITNAAGVVTTWTGINNEHLYVTRSGTTLTFARNGGVTATGVKAELNWEGTTGYQPTSTESAYADILTTSGSQATHGDYRHGRLLISTAGSRLTIVNELKLNTEYLYGIAEMPSSWGPAALQAQAIAARGYALRNSTSTTATWHLYDDARSQNFTGWTKQNEGTNAFYGKRWVAAVNATNNSAGTSGQVLTYGTGGASRIATTYYASSTGGQTENSEDVWSSTVSYLRAKADPWSLASGSGNPNIAWSDSISQATARSVFGLPDVVSLRVVSYTSSSPLAAAKVVEARSSTGATSRISGVDNVRIKLGLKGAWIRTIGVA